MNRLIFFWLAIASSCLAEPTVKFQVEGEDATSASYYFFFSNGHEIERVRTVWNGGAQNPPEVTDYVFEGGEIQISHQTGTREQIPKLIKGEDLELDTKESYALPFSSTADMLVPTNDDGKLTESQRVDLANLIMLLAKDRDSMEEVKTRKGLLQRLRR